MPPANAHRNAMGDVGCTMQEFVMRGERDVHRRMHHDMLITHCALGITLIAHLSSHQLPIAITLSSQGFPTIGTIVKAYG